MATKAELIRQIAPILASGIRMLDTDSDVVHSSSTDSPLSAGGERTAARSAERGTSTRARKRRMADNASTGMPPDPAAVATRRRAS